MKNHKTPKNKYFTPFETSFVSVFLSLFEIKANHIIYEINTINILISIKGRSQVIVNHKITAIGKNIIDNILFIAFFKNKIIQKKKKNIIEIM